LVALVIVYPLTRLATNRYPSILENKGILKYRTVPSILVDTKFDNKMHSKK